MLTYADVCSQGLPASFLNRFTAVRVEELLAADLLFIALAAYPDIGEQVRP
jgi:midasin (ATPase involved in ribosome maturation)